MQNKKSIYSPIQSRNIALGLIILLAIFLFIVSLHILSALFSAVILYILFKPLFLYLVYKRHINASISAIIIILISFLIVVLPLSGLSLIIIDKLAKFRDIVGVEMTRSDLVLQPLDVHVQLQVARVCVGKRQIHLAVITRNLHKQCLIINFICKHYLFLLLSFYYYLKTEQVSTKTKI